MSWATKPRRRKLTHLLGAYSKYYVKNFRLLAGSASIVSVVSAIELVLIAYGRALNLRWPGNSVRFTGVNLKGLSSRASELGVSVDPAASLDEPQR